MNNIITEITPLKEENLFYVAYRNKKSFDYPLHSHGEFEINFVENCTGARRIVGDSVETLPAFDLCLIGPGLEHEWQQHECTADNIREITIQFDPQSFNGNIIRKSQLASIRNMLEVKAKSGLSFSMPTIMAVYQLLQDLTREPADFYHILKFCELLYILSKDDNARELSSGAFAHKEATTESRRIRKIENYIAENFRNELRLEDLAEIVCMTPSAFSRFFKLRTGRTVSEYIIDARLGHASRLLVSTTTSVLEICFECGFNNVSNFNRIFKRKKGCSPSTFREYYRKNKVII